MPSGAKKRKALAKKKKQSNINISHGDNDLVKTNESDAVEVSSGGSRDHRNKDAPPVRSNVDESTSVEVVHSDGDKTRKIDSDSEDIKKVHSRSSSSSSTNGGSGSGSGSRSHSMSGSSDDELQVTEKLELEPEKSKEEIGIVILDDSVDESGPAVDSIKLIKPVFEKVTPVTENYGVAELATDKTNDQLAVPSQGESTGASVTVKDIESNKMKDRVLPVSYKNDDGSSSAKCVVKKENGDKLVQSSNAPVIEGGAKYSDIPECSENQPLLAAAPPQAQKTSWKSCCGLFDL